MILYLYWARLLDLLLGERCHHCHTRVFPRDVVMHYHVCRGRTW